MGKPKIRFKGYTDEWEQRKLGEVAQCLDSERIPINAEEREKIPGEIPYYGAGNIQGYINKFLFDEELVLLLEDGDAFDDFRTKEIAQYICGKTWVNNHAHVLRPLGSAYFLYSILAHKDIRNWVQLAGSSRKKLVQKSMLNIELIMPKLKEQQKIGNYFRNLDHLITLHQRKYEKTQKLKKYMLQKMFPQNGRKVPEIRFSGFTEEWEQRKLDDVVEFLDTMRKPLEGAKRIPGPYPYYGASGIVDYVDGYLFDEELILLSEDGANITDRNYPVCFLASGKYWVNNHAHVLRTKQENENNFICNSLERKDYTQYNTGMAMPKLNKETCKKIPISCPRFEEQKKIGDYFRSLDHFITLHQQKCDELRNVKKFMLQNMFI
ncbi:restriction endonuclease subunit S [Blautia ammoniilytica]|uniref:Restriction endonuclease subunit S n=1 Tax=Blautia ammoniilytica TaxID=2981782 RepID=A0ABT2TSW8_9FIRM|nr:restriction endonuclease subunit S [Blautia ammoniilytica]MCU6765325.1 restriction endonuclease subunit S [Blautia ammoniilytica]SCH98330.1 Type I restriction modification DNA specificity domain [uncultured Blautia sp.]